MKKTMGRLLASAAALLGLGTVTSEPAAADCIDNLAKEANTLAASQMTFYKRRGQDSDKYASTGISIACAPPQLTSIDNISDCASAMRGAHEKFGGADTLKFDALRGKISEFRIHGVCDGTHLAESLPKSTPVPAGTYTPKMEQHFKAMTSACFADLNNRSNAINCMGKTAQAAVSLEDDFIRRLERAKQRSSNLTEQQTIQTGIDTVKLNCGPLTNLSGKFETMLEPTLKQMSACITSINFTAQGQRRDIVGIGHGDLTGITGDQKPTLYAMKEIAGQVLKLNYLGQYKPGAVPSPQQK